jgi:ribosomal protein S18 acetylase RimI-like enzyme
MAAGELHPASAEEFARLMRTLVATHVFPDEAQAAAVWADAPWRIQVTAGGEVAVLDRWRDHLGLLAIEALWCAPRSIPAHVRQLDALARERGFAGVVSPAVPVEQRHEYEAGGLHVFETVVTFVLSRRDARHPGPVADGLTIERAAAGDLGVIEALDARCFEALWRFDRRRLERHLAVDRVALARQGAEPIGYTLTTVGRGDAVLGRLCVAPERRRQGAGRALLDEAVASAFESGCDRVTLCTQTRNRASRSLYRDAGFRETASRLAFLRSD